MSVVVEDTTGLESEAEVHFTVNRLPTIQQLSLSPNPAYTLDDLVAVAVADDLDGDIVSLTYQWYENGLQTTHSGDTIPSSDVQTDDVWRVVVTPNDGWN